MGDRFDNVNWEKEFPQVPECVHKAVREANQRILQKENKKVRKISGKGILLLAACMTLLSGMTVFAASSLWQQRMDAMNREEVEEYFLSIAESGAPAFRYSRGLSAKEQDNFAQLYVAYEEGGIFPKGCVTMLSEVAEYKGKGVGYEPVSSTFFLSEEELSDEELLQIVDFYHKADYAMQKVAEQVTEDVTEPVVVETEPPVMETEVSAVVIEPVVMQDFEALKDGLEYYQFTVSSEEYVQEIATGCEYMYLGYRKEILRMPLGTDEAETIYTFGEEEFLFALDADKEDNLYVSFREYIAETDSYQNHLIKLSPEGELILEYDVASANNLSEHYAYKMLPDADGRLYVKDRWANQLLVYIFGADGAFEGTIQDEELETHPAGSMCLGEDGSVYVLGFEEIIKLDTEEKCVAEVYPYVSPEMAAAVDILYPLDEDSFYLLSYDGLFVTTLGEGTSTRILAPYELDIFSDGMRRYPVSKDTLVVANYADPGTKITYLRMTE
ncbi:MAG: hypothetical protein IJZ82_03555 [Lachnospiraceae bacterium]|nr:hypothetical protein [Lachnospiraceae bacterium]